MQRSESPNKEDLSYSFTRDLNKSKDMTDRSPDQGEMTEDINEKKQ